MSQLNDAIVAIVGPQINDGLVNHYQTNGATSSDLGTAEYEFLIANGATPAHRQDMWYELLRAAGYTGSLNDMLLPFWLAGGVFGPIAAPIFSGTIPDGVTCEEELFSYDAKPNYSTGGPITTWALVNPPVGMTISNQGVVRWTPNIGDLTATNIQVSGNNATGPAALSNAFAVTVNALPTVVSSNVDAAGTTLTIAVSADTTGTTGFTLRANGVPVALSAPVDGASQITFTCAQVYAGQTLTLDYTPGNVVDTATSCAMKAFVGASVTNNSTVPAPVAPVYQSSTVDTTGTKLTVVYDSNVAGGTGFTYSVNGGGAVALTGATVVGAEISFTVAQIYDTDTVTLSYTPGDVVGDPNGLAADPFSNQAVTNNSTVVVPVIPVYQSSSVDADGTTFRVNYDVNITGANGFTFTRDAGAPESLTGGVVTGSQIVFSGVSPTILQGEVIALTYDDVGGNVVSVASGDPAAAFSNQSTTNNSTQTGVVTPLFDRQYSLTASLEEDATFGRLSTGTLVDYEGVIRTIPDNGARFEGARVVYNLLAESTEQARTTSYVSKWSDETSLTSFPLIDVSAGTNFSSAWRGCSSLTSFPLINISAGTNFFNAWRGCSNLTSFPLIDTRAGTNFSFAWYFCSSLTSFPLIDTSAGTNFSSAWYGCIGLTSFPLIDTIAGTNFSNAWRDCIGLTSYQLINTSAVTNFSFAWRNCSSLTSFPLIDTSAGTDFSHAWRDCSSLTSFPLINTSAGTNFSNAWYGCSSLTSFPANRFDTVTATDFTDAFINCALDQTSVDNILVSIDTANTSNGTLNMTGGTSSPPSATGLTAKTSLEGRGWTVTVNT